MTRKNFVSLADTIIADGTFTDSQIDTLVRFCKEQNPRFKPVRFYAYLSKQTANQEHKSAK